MGMMIIEHIRRRIEALIRLIADPDRYHPERHYMRGPGPKSAARLRSSADER
jgi:hypothetical protein